MQADERITPLSSIGDTSFAPQGNDENLPVAGTPRVYKGRCNKVAGSTLGVKEGCFRNFNISMPT